MKPRPDFLEENSPQGIEVFQLTEEEIPWSHLYMEAQVFTPDSRFLLLHRAATAHGGNRKDPAHQYWLCDLSDRGKLSPLTEETGAWAPSVSPDGKWVYYFVDRSQPAGGNIELKRVKIDGTNRETLLFLENIPGTKKIPSRLYPLSTISSDGQRLAISAFLGDGRTQNPPFGLLIFDLVKGTCQLILEGPTWCNLHTQYCRSLQPEESHDLLLQENHGCVIQPDGTCTLLVGEPGADIHLLRDDGTNFRTMPWGRDGIEHCQGHQCWRGRSYWAITSTTNYRPHDSTCRKENHLLESQACPDKGHLGLKTPGGCRNVLSRDIPQPGFWHFATDISGQRFIGDVYRPGQSPVLCLARLGRPGIDPLLDYTYLFSTRTSSSKNAHPHPFLSPDGRLGFFNSDESGVVHAYLIILP